MATQTIEEIKERIAADFMNNDTVAELYDFEVGDNFNNHFSRVSLINILFYIFAAAAWIQENLFEDYLKELEKKIEESVPHRPKWYRDRTLKFMLDKELVDESDLYDTSEMSPEQIEKARVVKSAIAVEDPDSSALTIKVRGENGELDEDTRLQLEAYLAEIKDAGVKIHVISQPGDSYSCEVDVYYNPMMLKDTVRDACESVIREYVENLPFNGEYSHMALVDRLQVVEGVKIAEVLNAYAKAYTEEAAVPIRVKHIPQAGYFKAQEIILNMHSYE